MAAVKHHFTQWAHSPENNRAPGRTCLDGIARMEQGMQWSQSGIVRSKGCGSAMRAAPIGYLYQHDPHKLRQVALALYCFLRYPNDYKKAVIRGANTNGDSDSIACIAGSISGARLGAEGIPEAWALRIEKAGALNALAQRLERKKGELQTE